MSTTSFTDASRFFQDLEATRDQPGLAYYQNLGWVVSRHADVVEALGRPDVFSSKPLEVPFPPELEHFRSQVPDKGTLIGYDNPDHDRLRAAVNTFFMPKNLERFSAWIEATAHQIADEIYELGSGDLRELLSSPLPMRVICHIVGVDPNEWQRYHQALRAFTQMDPSTFNLVLDFHDELREVMEERRVDRRDDLISHVWNLRDAGEVEMTDFEMLSLFPGLMLAGHETSSNLIITALNHLLAIPGLYQRVQQSDTMRAKAIEEAIRYEAPIAGMPRLALKDCELGGTQIKAGDRLFLAYSSANRDACKYADAATFDPDRELTANAHVGFAQGIHACLGAPLARLLLGLELKVLGERFPGLQTARPYEERTYIPVGPVRALIDSHFEWVVDAEHLALKGAYKLPATEAESRWLTVEIESVRHAAESVVEFKVSGATLPDWVPGAHIDVELAPGLIRQYSLCGDPGDEVWTIAISDSGHQGAGAAAAHRDVKVGQQLRVGKPRNNFRFEPKAKPIVFMAAGIGVTPLIPMARAAKASGLAQQFIYVAKTKRHMAYINDLSALLGDELVTWESSISGRIDLGCQLDQIETGSIVYACGPESFLDNLAEVCQSRGIELNVERFHPSKKPQSEPRAFEVKVQPVGATIQVAADQSLLEALNAAGFPVPSTCTRGTCGTCEVKVVSGDIDHRDVVLSRADRLAGDTMISCVSRCLGDKLVLDLG